MKLASFNVRGLASECKRFELSIDLDNHDIDICTLQETKVSKVSEQIVGNYHIFFMGANDWHYGLGFAVHKRWRNNILYTQSVNDRMARLEMKYTETQRMQIINVYGPTQVLVDRNPEIADVFWQQLDKLRKSCGNLYYIMGDFNSKVGKPMHCNREVCLGPHSRGRRNENGQRLVDFCCSNSLFVANSAFSHKARHITTWVGQRKINNRIEPIFNQIDYVLIRNEHKKRLTNARTYSGTKCQSDHRLLVVNLDMKIMFRIWYNIKKPAREKKFNTRMFSNLTVKNLYSNSITEKLHQYTIGNEGIKKCTEKLLNTLKSEAKEKIGFLKPEKSVSIYCSELERMSDKRKKIKCAIENNNSADNKRELRHERNQLSHEMRRVAKQNRMKHLNKLAENIEKSTGSDKMFQAVQAMRSRTHNKVIIQDSNGNSLENSTDKANAAKDHFSAKFNGLEPILPSGRILTQKITTDEVQQSIKKLRNNRAAGPDNVPGELLKYGGNEVARLLAEIYNQSLAEGDPHILGEGRLIALQKPGKPIGPLTSLRPITLLRTIRKVLSLLTLNRIRPKVEEYLGPGQSGFRPNRSTTDVVWMHKYLAAHTQRIDSEIHVLGTDLSAAFDTVNRAKLMNVLNSFLNADEVAMCAILLADTKLQIKIDNSLSDWFITTVGIPQGDSISPVLFVIYFEAAIREIRSHIQRPELDVQLNLPLDVGYADDLDFISTSKSFLETLEVEVCNLLGNWNLKMNREKTEWTKITREIDKTDETWRRTKKLGSLLGDSDDVNRRKTLAFQAFGRMFSLWNRTEIVSESTRLRIYNAFVKPVLMYNTETLALNKADKTSLDVFHRKQLRILLGIFWPDRISNENLYARCECGPISLEILKRKWQTLGHILRRDANVPANLVMDVYHSNDNKSSFHGRSRTTLPVTIISDLGQVDDMYKYPYRNSQLDEHSYSKLFQISKKFDFGLLKEMAQHRQTWRQLTELVVEAQTKRMDVRSLAT